MSSITSNILQKAKELAGFLAKVPGAAMVVLEDTAKRIETRMNVPGDPISYPVNWDSPLQRAGFFASDGFGGGIPYSRTGDTAWSVSKPFNEAVDLFAPHPAGAVFGMPNMGWWRSKIHAGRWVELKVVFFDEISKIPDEMQKQLTVVANGQRPDGT